MTRTPTSLSMALCKLRGWSFDIAEHWNSFAKRRVDLFGCIDIVACADRIVGIQSTVRGEVSKRVAKALAEPRLESWLRSGGRFIVWGWDEPEGRGAKRAVTMRGVEITYGREQIQQVETWALASLPPIARKPRSTPPGTAPAPAAAAT